MRSLEPRVVGGLVTWAWMLGRLDLGRFGFPGGRDLDVRFDSFSSGRLGGSQESNEAWKEDGNGREMVKITTNERSASKSGGGPGQLGLRLFRDL